jgi:hypothetical protein
MGVSCELLKAPKLGTLPSSNAAIYEAWPNGYSSCTGSSIAILPYEDAVPKIMLVQCSRAPLRGSQTIYNLVIIHNRHQAEQPRGAVASWAETLEALHAIAIGRIGAGNAGKAGKAGKCSSKRRAFQPRASLGC